MSACKSKSNKYETLHVCVCEREWMWTKSNQLRVYFSYIAFGSAVRWYDNSAISHKQRLINGAAEPFVLLEAADLFLIVVWASFPFDRSSIMAFHHRPASAPSCIITQMSLMLTALCQTAHTECDLRPEWFAAHTNGLLIETLSSRGEMAGMRPVGLLKTDFQAKFEFKVFCGWAGFT